MVVSPSFCLLVIGPLGLPGALTSAERSGRVMLCRAGPLEVEPPWYCSSSARRSARFSWITSAERSSLKHSASNDKTKVSKVRSKAGLYRMARRRILMASRADLSHARCALATRGRPRCPGIGVLARGVSCTTRRE